LFPGDFFPAEKSNTRDSILLSFKKKDSILQKKGNIFYSADKNISQLLPLAHRTFKRLERKTQQ
jgi:hypothetical protein